MNLRAMVAPMGISCHDAVDVGNNLAPNLFRRGKCSVPTIPPWPVKFASFPSSWFEFYLYVFIHCSDGIATFFAWLFVRDVFLR